MHEDDPPWAVTGAGLSHWRSSQPQRARAGAWAAAAGDGVVGYARARLQWGTTAPGVAEVWAFVHPAHRRGGIGGRLYAEALAHVQHAGARTVLSWSSSVEGGSFLRRRGFRAVGTAVILALDLGRADLSGLGELRRRQSAQGFDVVPLAAVADRRGLYAVEAEATPDVPEPFSWDNVGFEDWSADTLAHPQLTAEGSFVVLEGGRPVAYALLHVDPSARLAANEMTGTARSYRSRGLARLAKLETIRWASEQGYHRIVTDTAEDNAAMRALNESLGYRRIGTETEYVLDALS